MLRRMASLTIDIVTRVRSERIDVVIRLYIITAEL